MKCSKCDGAGKFDQHICPKCHGKGELDWIDNIVGAPRPSIPDFPGGLNWLEPSLRPPDNPHFGDAYFNETNNTINMYDGKRWLRVESSEKQYTMF